LKEEESKKRKCVDGKWVDVDKKSWWKPWSKGGKINKSRGNIKSKTLQKNIKYKKQIKIIKKNIKELKNNKKKNKDIIIIKKKIIKKILIKINKGNEKIKKENVKIKIKKEKVKIKIKKENVKIKKEKKNKGEEGK